MKNDLLVKRTGVNYDYILGLKKDEEGILVEEYPITRHEYEIDKALELLNDKKADINDVYNAIRICLPNETYDFCLGYEYDEKYIGDIGQVYDLYYELKDELRKQISSELDRRKRKLPEVERNNWFRIIEIEGEIRENLQWLIKRQKEKFLKKALPCIYAYDYDSALKENKIKDDCIVYSSDTHGDKRKYGKPRGYHVTHKINEELSIRIETNFCYGSSSYFHVVISYKNIDLIPYSIWVRYFYARYNDLMGFTRSFERKRENWNNCLNFISSFINSAIQNPETFIRTEVMREVQDLLKGLEEIFCINEFKMESEIKVKKKEGDERYIGINGVHYANDYESEMYYINPSEISMIYKMEKISGALRFLESLDQVSMIYPEVKKTKDRIIELNQLIFPEIEEAIPKVNFEIKSLLEQIRPLKKEMEKYEKTFNKMKSYLDQKLRYVVLVKERDIITEEYKSSHPLYVELENKIEKLKPIINDLNDKIYNREKTLKRLNGFKDLILKNAYN